MTKVFDVHNWEEFQEKLKEIQRRHETNDQLSSTLLFRGHSDSRWLLETTLERSHKKEVLFTDYYRTISSLQPEIETFTNNRWENPEYPDIIPMAGKYEFFHLNQDLHTSIYGYMAHLRHHGFPSPLLDWTRSPYVAAYFAFSDAIETQKVSIYVLSQANARTGSSNEPQIFTFGPRVRTHRRHFLQQCEYSLCATYAESDWQFVEHEKAATDRDEKDEFLFDLAIYKFNIPGSERLKILKMLDQYNLNAFSLFGTEESLMKTLSLREFHFST